MACCACTDARTDDSKDRPIVACFAFSNGGNTLQELGLALLFRRELCSLRGVLTFFHRTADIKSSAHLEVC